MMFNEKIISAVVPAAGLGKRMGGDKKKQFLETAGKIDIDSEAIDKLREESMIS